MEPFTIHGGQQQETDWLRNRGERSLINIRWMLDYYLRNWVEREIHWKGVQERSELRLWHKDLWNHVLGPLLKGHTETRIYAKAFYVRKWDSKNKSKLFS